MCFNDLKEGYLIQIRKGNIYFIQKTAKGELCGIRKEGYWGMTNFNIGYPFSARSFDKINTNDNFDIVRVWGLPSSSPTDFYELLCTSNRELLWEEKEVKEMTVAEISKALGYEVKIVK